MLAVESLRDAPNGAATLDQKEPSLVGHEEIPDYDLSPGSVPIPTRIEIQERLRDIWAIVLQDDPSNFSGEDVFFEVGGDSITAQRLVEAAAKEGIRLTMEQIFMNASLEDMAETARLVEPTRGHASLAYEDGPLGRHEDQDKEELDEVAKYCGLPASSIQSTYGLTPMQESLLVEDVGGSNSYVRQFVFRMRPGLTVNDLQRAWNETIQANAVLRTRICQLQVRKTVQAVVTEDAEPARWNVVRSSLDQFLEQDSREPMLAGDAFFRYAIIEEEGESGTRYFVWTAHHTLCDGASIPEILSDVARRFHGKPVPPRPPFASFIRSSAVLPDPGLEQQFWTQALSGIHPTPWPTVPQGLDFRANANTVLEHRLTLEQFPSFGITKSLLLRAAWAILLSHYTGTEDVNFGAINNGRTAAVPDVSRMTGPTINLVPIALNVNPEQSVSGFLSRIRHQAAEMMPFEHSGPSRIRRFLAMSGGGQQTSALDLQSLLVVHPASFGGAIEPSMQDLGLEYVDELGKKEQHPYPLVLTFTPSSDSPGDTSILLRIEHDERVVPAPQAIRLAHHLQAVLTRLSQSTENTLLGSIDPLSAHDLHEISEWNASTPPAEETCLHHLFERQVRRQPDALAVCSLGESLTYAEVDTHASSLAMRLVKFGVRPGVYVGVCFDKSIWTVVSILAVFKAGGIYVPIDPAHPRGRIEEIVRMVRMKTALASPAGAQVLEEIFDPGDLSIIQVDGHPAHRPWKQPSRVAQPSDTAYLLFTSGSTGKPKGILMPHRAICTSILHHGPAFEAGPSWRTLQFCAHTFDLSIAEFFTTLSFGGCVCVPSEEDRTNDLAGVITALRANTLIVVPTVANLLLPTEVPTLESLILSGEPIPKETILRWADHINLTCAYGPSETAVWCSANLRVGRHAHQSHVGRALGASMWIVDAEDHTQLTAVGCVGEIAISGALLGGGYFGDRATTDAAFVAVPEWMRRLTGDTMMYRSGDLGRYNPDGTFHVVGRRDTQVKLRGLRIELGEIENRLTQGGLVTAALACLPSSGPAARRIVAVMGEEKSDLDQGVADTPSKPSPAKRVLVGSITCKTRDESAALVGRLKQRLQLALPDYMVPSVWIVLDKMPLLISGKLDRKKLKQWVQDMSVDTYNELVGANDQSQAGGKEVVTGSLADKLRQAWSDVLEVPASQLGLTTSFFAVGGDSIAAIQIASHAKRAVPGLPISVRAIINAKTLGNLATMLEEKQQGDGEIKEERRENRKTSPRVSAHPQESILVLLERYRPLLEARLAQAGNRAQVEDAHHLSAFQREILRQRNANPAVFLMSWRMELSSHTGEPLSLPRLEAAWRSAVARFPVLRSIFLKEAPERLGLPVVQVVLGADAATEAAVVVSELESPSEPEPGFGDSDVPGVDECFLPHRAHIMRRAERVFLHVEMDHLIIDGWSLGLIKKALLEAYEGIPYQGSGSPSYSGFVAAQGVTDRAQADDVYWARLLDGFSPSLLSGALSGPEKSPKKQLQQQHVRQNKVILPFPPIPAAGLTHFSAANGVTPASMFSAAWAQTLSRFTGKTDVAFEYVVSGRDDDDDDDDDDDEGGQQHDIGGSIWDLVGCCINVLAHRVRDVAVAGVAGLAAKLQEQSAEGARHGASNVREVAERLVGPARLFDTAVNFQRRPAAVENEAKTVRVGDDLTRSVDPWHFDVLVRVLHITDDNTFRPSLEFFAQDYNPEAMQQVGQDWWQRVRDLVV